MSRQLIITIDGFSGAGKSARALALAKKLDFNFIGIGCFFRAIAYLQISFGHFKNTDQLYISPGGGKHGKEVQVYFENINITSKLYSNPQIDEISSIISQRQDVREKVKKILFSITQKGNWVIEGRSGGQLFPKANIGFFLEVSRQERENRIKAEAIRRGKDNKTAHAITQLSLKRDKMDLRRDLEPVRFQRTSVVINSTYLTPDETLNVMLFYVRTRLDNLPTTISVVYYPYNSIHDIYASLTSLKGQKSIIPSSCEILLSGNASKYHIDCLRKSDLSWNIRSVDFGSDTWSLLNLSDIDKIQGDLCVFLDCPAKLGPKWLEGHLNFHRHASNLLVMGGIFQMSCVMGSPTYINQRYPRLNVSILKHTLVNALKRRDSKTNTHLRYDVLKYVHLCQSKRNEIGCFVSFSTSGNDQLQSNDNTVDYYTEWGIHQDVLCVELSDLTDQAFEKLQNLVYQSSCFEKQHVVLLDVTPTKEWEMFVQVNLGSLGLNYCTVDDWHHTSTEFVSKCHAAGLTFSQKTLFDLGNL